MLKGIDVEPNIKRELPQILTRINTDRSREALIAGLYMPDVTISYRALKGLNKLRAVDRLSYDQDAFLPVLQMWAKQYYGLLNIDLALPERSGPGCQLLGAAVEERMNWTIEKIFRGLALFIPRGEAYFSYLGYTSNRRELRANAVELIDLRLPAELKTTLLPIFSDSPPRHVLGAGRRLFGLPSTSAEILSEALFERDPWLKCCILSALVDLRHEIVRPRIQQATHDLDPRVRETAQWVLDKWSGSAGAAF